MLTFGAGTRSCIGEQFALQRLLLFTANFSECWHLVPEQDRALVSNLRSNASYSSLPTFQNADIWCRNKIVHWWAICAPTPLTLHCQLFRMLTFGAGTRSCIGEQFALQRLLLFTANFSECWHLVPEQDRALVSNLRSNASYSSLPTFQNADIWCRNKIVHWWAICAPTPLTLHCQLFRMLTFGAGTRSCIGEQFALQRLLLFTANFSECWHLVPEQDRALVSNLRSNASYSSLPTFQNADIWCRNKIVHWWAICAPTPLTLHCQLFRMLTFGAGTRSCIGEQFALQRLLLFTANFSECWHLVPEQDRALVSNLRSNASYSSLPTFQNADIWCRNKIVHWWAICAPTPLTLHCQLFRMLTFGAGTRSCIGEQFALQRLLLFTANFSECWHLVPEQDRALVSNLRSNASYSSLPTFQNADIWCRNKIVHWWAICAPTPLTLHCQLFRMLTFGAGTRSCIGEQFALQRLLLFTANFSECWHLVPEQDRALVSNLRSNASYSSLPTFQNADIWCRNKIVYWWAICAPTPLTLHCQLFRMLTFGAGTRSCIGEQFALQRLLLFTANFSECWHLVPEQDRVLVSNLRSNASYSSLPTFQNADIWCRNKIVHWWAICAPTPLTLHCQLFRMLTFGAGTRSCIGEQFALQRLLLFTANFSECWHLVPEQDRVLVSNLRSNALTLHCQLFRMLTFGAGTRSCIGEQFALQRLLLFTANFSECWHLVPEQDRALVSNLRSNASYSSLPTFQNADIWCRNKIVHWWAICAPTPLTLHCQLFRMLTFGAGTRSCIGEQFALQRLLLFTANFSECWHLVPEQDRALVSNLRSNASYSSLPTFQNADIWCRNKIVHWWAICAPTPLTLHCQLFRMLTFGAGTRSCIGEQFALQRLLLFTANFSECWHLVPEQDRALVSNLRSNASYSSLPTFQNADIWCRNKIVHWWAICAPTPLTLHCQLFRMLTFGAGTRSCIGEQFALQRLLLFTANFSECWHLVPEQDRALVSNLRSNASYSSLPTFQNADIWCRNKIVHWWAICAPTPLTLHCQLFRMLTFGAGTRSCIGEQFALQRLLLFTANFSECWHLVPEQDRALVSNLRSNASYSSLPTFQNADIWCRNKIVHWWAICAPTPLTLHCQLFRMLTFGAGTRSCIGEQFALQRLLLFTANFSECWHLVPEQDRALVSNLRSNASYSSLPTFQNADIWCRNKIVHWWAICAPTPLTLHCQLRATF